MSVDHPNRRQFCQWIASSTTLLTLPDYLLAESSLPPKPNFVFILVDDLGWSDLGCYGADLHETPNIDRFASQCMRFTDAYAASPVCTPTRASILTGKHPARLHMTVWRESTLEPPDPHRKLIPPQCVSDLPHSEVTLAEALKGAGYQTAHIGKWHLGDASHYPETQGFDVNIGGSHWGAPPTYFYPYRGEEYFHEYRYVPHLEFGREGEYLTDRLTDEALKVMEKMKDAPFFLYLAYHTVHSPIEGKPEMVDFYQTKLKEGYNHHNATYAAMVHSLDENVGRVIQRIDELGIAENTVVVLFSDNGGVANSIRGQIVTNNAPLRSGKGSLYEGGIREPLLIRWPGVTEPGSLCNEPVCSTDFFPTFLDIAGIDSEPAHNPDLDGVSLIALLKNPKTPLPRESFYWHYPHYYPTTTPVGAIRQGKWKLLEYFEDGHLELFNLNEDICEQNNLAEQRPEIAAELKKNLYEWRMRVKAQMPHSNTNQSDS